MFVLELLIALITGDMDAANEAFKEYMGEMGEHMGKFKELFGDLRAKAQVAWDGIKNAAAGAWNGIRGVWSVLVMFQHNHNPLVFVWNYATQSIKNFFYQNTRIAIVWRIKRHYQWSGRSD